MLHDTEAISHVIFGSFLYHLCGCGRAHRLSLRLPLNLLHTAAFVARSPGLPSAPLIECSGIHQVPEKGGFALSISPLRPVLRPLCASNSPSGILIPSPPRAGVEGFNQSQQRWLQCRVGSFPGSNALCGSPSGPSSFPLSI